MFLCPIIYGCVRAHVCVVYVISIYDLLHIGFPKTEKNLLCLLMCTKRTRAQAIHHRLARVCYIYFVCDDELLNIFV